MVPSRPRLRLFVLFALAISAYLPALQLPFIADDYHQIPIARADSLAGWAPLWHDTLLRTRFTYMWLSAFLDRNFGFDPQPFYVVSIALHVACVVMLYLICIWRAIPRAIAYWSAAFFAIQEGHQEAVMWLAASYDLLVFLFGMAALTAWTKWLNERRVVWYIFSLGAFIIAGFSKETFWVFALLMLVITVWERRKAGLLKALAELSPFLLLSAGYIVFIWMTKIGPGAAAVDHRFALLGTMWIQVFFRGVWDLLFPFGLIALGILAWARHRGDRWLAGFALLWIVLGVLPHSFLTYMPRLASRHTYLASGGLALLFGVAMSRLSKRVPGWAFALVMLIVMAVNLEIIWVKKLSQFRERGEPTELLRVAAMMTNGPITVDCITVPDIVVTDALAQFGATAILRKQMPQNDHCFAIEYHDRYGAVVRVNRRIGQPHGAFH